MLERTERLRQEQHGARQRRVAVGRRVRSAIACVSRSPSSYHVGASRSVTSRQMPADVAAATRRLRQPVEWRGHRRVAARDRGRGARRRSRGARRRRRTRSRVLSSTHRTARSTTAVDTGNRCSARSAGPARRSASRLEREEVDGGDAAQPSQRATGDDTGGVGGHEHGHGAQHVAGLGRGHGLGERGVGAAGGDRDDVETHRVDRTVGVCQRPTASRAACSASCRNSTTACSRPSGSRNRALPAISTLAPARTAPRDGGRADPAVDLDLDPVGQPAAGRSSRGPRGSWAPSWRCRPGRRSPG